MKQQIARFSPHQNGKVVAVMSAVGSLVFIVPLYLLFAAIAPAGQRPSLMVMLAMPVLYLVLGYAVVAIGCAVYNAMYAYIGGIEYESIDA